MKLLLVDDETIIRKGILKHIPWGDLGIHEVKAAADADSALKMIDEWIPDIVLSDICMRGMDGIELCREILRRIPECQIIFLSGYSQKEYLKAAIEMGAVQYLEKPISVQELSKAVEKAAGRLENLAYHKFVTQEYQEHFHVIQRDILKRMFCPLNEEERKKTLSEAGLMTGKEEELRVCFLIPASDSGDFQPYLTDFLETCKRSMHAFCVTGESGKVFGETEQIVLILSAAAGHLEKNSVKMQKIHSLVQGAPEEGKFFMAVGERIRMPEKMNESIRSAQKVTACLAYKGYGNMVFAEEESAVSLFKIPAEFEKKFTDGLDSRNAKLCKKALEEVYHYIVSQHAAMNGYVKNLYFALYTSMEKQLGAFEEKERELSVEKFEKARTFSELHELLMELLKKKMESEAEKQIPAVSYVLEEIQKRYSDKNLSIAQLAEEQMLTAAYLSVLFRQQTGKTIKQYLIDVRIGHAKELLKNHTYKFYQVSDMVGYQDAAYFTRLFRTQTGMTPSEYREKIRE